MIETIGDAWDYGWKITVRCAFGRREGLKSVRECMGTLAVDLQTMMWTRGRAFPLDSIAARMKCPVCGSRKVRVLWDPPRGGMPVRMRKDARG
jgi:hypothetical protein